VNREDDYGSASYRTFFGTVFPPNRIASQVETDAIIAWNKRLTQLRKERTGMLDAISVLKHFDANEGIDIDELVALHAAGSAIQASYVENSLNVPTWLPEALRAVKREIGERRRDFKARDLAMLRAKLESKKSESQTTGEIEAKIAALEAELNE